jgi:hypothetical protein
MATRKSITFTVLIWVGILLAVAGAVVAILGLGGAIEFSAKVGSIELKSTSVGLAICAMGCLLAGYVATRLPKGVQVLGPRHSSFLRRVSERGGWLIALGVVLAVISLIGAYR